MKKIFFILFLLITNLLFSQLKVDSLKLELQKTTIDSVKIKLLHHLFYQSVYDSPEFAKESIIKAINLSKQTNNKRLLAESYNYYADFLYSQSTYDSAITSYQKGLDLSRKNKYNRGMYNALSGLGKTFLEKGNFKKALEYQKLNSEMAEKLNDTLRIANSYLGIAAIHHEIEDYTKAMEYYTLASKKYQQIGNLLSFGIALTNISGVLIQIEDYENALNYCVKSDSIFNKLDYKPGKAYVLRLLASIYTKKKQLEYAIDNQLKALSMYKLMGEVSQVAEVQHDIGKLYDTQEKHEKALTYYIKSLNIQKRIGDSVRLALSYNSIGESYYRLKNNKKAKAYLLKALDVAKRTEIDPVSMFAYENLSSIYADEKNFSKAYKNRIQYAKLKDSFYNKEKRELALDIEAKYQNEQKVKENTLLATKNDLQRLQINKSKNERNTIITFAIILLVLAGLLFYLFRVKQKANIELKELNRLKSNFFANISHEFRTPLTLIKGPIEQLEQNFDEKLSMNTVKMIRRNTNRVLNLVNQLLDLSKIDEGNLQLKLTEGDVYKCLRSVIVSFNSLAAQHYIDYRLQIPNTVLWASFDRDKLEKIMYNLLSNAFKFSDEDSIISCDITYNGQILQVQVNDTGKGISTKKLPFIFDRFYQADGSFTKEVEGSGIGLSLTKELVEFLNGTITASSELNKGSFFTFQIPVQEILTRKKLLKKRTQIKKNSYKPQSFTFTSIDKRNVPSILLVEDNNDMRNFIKEELIEFYKVNESTNGEEGLYEAIINPPDLIITDLMMPKMDGITLCEKLKTNVNTSHIPVIMLTAKAGIDNKIEGLETGADEYFTKPFNVNELMVRIKNLIEQRQKLRELFTNNEIQIDPKKVTVTSIDQKFLEQVLILLEDQFSDPSFGVAQMQENLSMSKAQLHRKLKALTNEAPGELLRNFRLKRAAQLITQKADTVTQIAYMVGFNDLSYFSKRFKELYGATPSAYQN